MGWFTHFRRTWRPGYSADVIDPDKAFDFERRVIIVKKVIILFLLLAILIGLICFLVALLSSKTHESAPTSSGISSPPSGAQESIKTSSIISSLPSMTDDDIAVSNSVIVSSLTNEDNSTTKSLMVTTLPPTKYNGTDKPSMVTSLPTVISNNTFAESHGSSENLFCSSNVMDCIALSKNFKSVMTFSNSSRKHNGTAEGYVMVKMGNNTWHPYCHSKWILQMGHSLCTGLGFQQLRTLQTIDIAELKQRLAHRLGKDISLHSENQPLQPPHELLVLTTESSLVPVQANSSQFNCNVGYISCL